MVLFATPVVSMRCRIYAFGDTEVDFTNCTDGECAVTIYSTGSSWRYYKLDCEQNCLPINESIRGYLYITACCSYNLCSLDVLQTLNPNFPDNVNIKRIDPNYASSFAATSTSTAFITSNTSFSITGTPVETMITSSPSPSSNTSK